MHHKKELQELMRTYSSMKALQLLVALADCEGEISLAQLSAATGIPPSSTHRILQEMQHCGFVINKDGATAADIAELMRRVAEKVEKDSGVVLEPEVKRLGEF